MPIFSHRAFFATAFLLLLLPLHLVSSGKEFLPEPKKPIPSCESLGITDNDPGDQCDPECNKLGLLYFTSVNAADGRVTCGCQNVDRSTEVNYLYPICTDSPSCFDLGIMPGTALEQCTAYCNSASLGLALVQVEDYADASESGRIDLVVGCSCDGGETYVCGPDRRFFADPNSAQPCNGEPIVSSEDVDRVVVPKVAPKQVTSPTVRDAKDCHAFCDGFPEKSVSMAEYTPVDGNERGEASCKCAFDFDNDRIVICSNDAERPRSEMSDYCGGQHDYSMCFYPTTSYLQDDEVGEEDEYSKSSASPLVVVGSVLSLVAIVVVAVVVY